jgi:aspartate kinase
MITMKFGGTSVGDAERLCEVAAIVRTNLSCRPVVVASAMSGVTDLLLGTAHLALERRKEEGLRNTERLREKHLEIVTALVEPGEARDRLVREQGELVDKLETLLRGVHLLGELSPRSLDAIASFGELLSCMQIAAILEARGIPARFVDARPLIRTDSGYGEAAVDFEVTNPALRGALLPLVESGVVPVVTGFVASNPEGITTTLGRSGSDYTASIVGAALGSEEIWIWTDVDGVMTADPRVVEGAAPLGEISYREAAEMSYFGAKVIHPKTMQPAIDHGTPIRIKNTFNPAHPGTLISSSGSSSAKIVKNVTSIDKLGLVAVEGSGLMGAPGVIARLFASLARVGVNVMMISQASSEHNVCLIIPEKDCRRAVEELRTELGPELARKTVEAVRVRDSVSIIAVVGEGMRGVPGIAARTFTAAARADVNIIAIAQGSSELNISFVVDQSEAHRAVRAIHDAFQLA